MVNKVLTTLTAILALAKRHKKIKDNPVEEAERLKIATEDEGDAEVTPDKVYSKEEIRKLIHATTPGTIDRLFVMLPALTGLRIGEALGATWPAVDLKAGKFNVRLNLADNNKGEPLLLQPPKTKTSKRTIALPPELIHELKVWKRLETEMPEERTRLGIRPGRWPGLSLKRGKQGAGPDYY
jgi:integrase